MHRASVLLFVICMFGCGSSSDKSDNIGGVPRSTELKNVTQSDLMALCKAKESQLESLGNCTVKGLEGDTEAECNDTRATCEKDTSTASADIDCSGASTDDLGDCTITVGEFSDCLDELERYLTALTCKDAGKQLTPPSCFSNVQTKCASLFSS